jgi:hypothetical protein
MCKLNKKNWDPNGEPLFFVQGTLRKALKELQVLLRVCCARIAEKVRSANTKWKLKHSQLHPSLRLRDGTINMTILVMLVCYLFVALQ